MLKVDHGPVTECVACRLHCKSPRNHRKGRLMTKRFLLAILITGAVETFAAAAVVNHTTATLTQQRGFLSATTVDSKAMFGGGFTNVNPPSDSAVVDIYDSSTGLWSTASLAQPRPKLAAASAGVVVAVGRGDGNGALASGGDDDDDDDAAERGAEGVVGCPGSGVMMLMGGVEAAVGNSALVGLPSGVDGGSAATGPGVTAGMFHDGA